MGTLIIAYFNNLFCFSNIFTMLLYKNKVCEVSNVIRQTLTQHFTQQNFKEKCLRCQQHLYRVFLLHERASLGSIISTKHPHMEFTLPSNTRETKGDPICSPHWCHQDTDSKPCHELNEQVKLPGFLIMMPCE